MWDKICKLIIDSDNSMNVIFKAIVAKMKLQPEPHPIPIK